MADRRGVLTGSRVRLGLASDEWLVACVRRGQTAAFETLYDRHVRELLGFCIYMLSSRQDGEDAVQATFASAYRALRADSRPVALRPWLFTIARNECLTLLRRRRPVAELVADEVPSREDPADQIEVRDEMRHVFEGLRDLPESQRAALVLAEVHGLSHSEVGEAMGVRADQVKAFVYQARTKLVSDRAARNADCREIREELAGARGAALLRGRLRRHVRSCPECRSFADGVARQRRQLGALLPIVPSLALKARAIEQALGVSSGDPGPVAQGATVGATAAAAGTAAELAGGGGIPVFVCKVAVGFACLGAGAGVGVSVLSSPLESAASTGRHTSSTSAAQLVASLEHGESSSVVSEAQKGTGRELAAGTVGGERSYSDAGGSLPAVQNGVTVHEEASAGPAPGEDRHGDSGVARPDNARSEGGSHGGGSARGERSIDLERRAESERRQTEAAGRRQRHEELRRAHEEPKASRPPKTEEELQLKREKHAKHHEEHKPEGHSRLPLTPEEIRLRREERETKKQQLREELERRKREAEEAEASSSSTPLAPRAEPPRSEPPISHPAVEVGGRVSPRGSSRSAAAALESRR